MRYLYGNNLANTLTARLPDSYTVYGYGGNDRITGGAYADTVFGGTGNDTIQGLGGNDKVFGEAGNDFIAAGTGNDTASGGDGDDDVYGQDGNDNLLGGLGWDFLSGGNGTDTIDGGSGDDQILGGSGNDRIAGGSGDDDLWGDSGFDIFKFSDGSGFDVVEDFTFDFDRIQLDRSDVWDFDDVYWSAYQVGWDTWIDFGSDVIVLAGIDADSLIPSDFIIL